MGGDVVKNKRLTETRGRKPLPKDEKLTMLLPILLTPDEKNNLTNNNKYQGGISTGKFLKNVLLKETDIFKEFGTDKRIDVDALMLTKIVVSKKSPSKADKSKKTKRVSLALTLPEFDAVKNNEKQIKKNTGMRLTTFLRMFLANNTDLLR